MTLYRIFSGASGIDYHEHRNELGFVVADTKEDALIYARTLAGFAKPDNGYDADLIASGRPPAATEGYVLEIYPFIMTQDNFSQLQELLKQKQQLIEQKLEAQQHLEAINRQLKQLK